MNAIDILNSVSIDTKISNDYGVFEKINDDITRGGVWFVHQSRCTRCKEEETIAGYIVVGLPAPRRAF